MSKTIALKRFITSPVVVVFVFSLLLVVLNIYLSQRSRPYTSDDVSWQNILSTWTPLNGHKVDMGAKDNFLVNVPLLILLGHILPPSRTLLFVEASTFAAINFVLVYFSGLYFLRKCRIKISYETLLPFLWLASLGYNFSQLFLNSAWRDFEIGLSFVYFVLITKYYYGEINPLKSWLSKILTILTILAAGIFNYSDPYFFYLTVGPIAAWFLVLFIAKKATKSQLLVVLGGALFSLLVSRGVSSIAARVGLFTPQGSSVTIIPLSHLVGEFITTVDEMTTIFGVNISGVRILSMSGVASILNLAIIIVVAVWFAIFVYRHRKRQLDFEGRQSSPFIFLSLFFGALYILVFIACLLNGEDDYRYFVMSVYLLAMLAAFVVGTLRKRALAFTVLVWAAICINLATSVFALTPMQKANASGNKANAANYALIEKIKMLGLSKGYVNYWDGNINTYLSDGSIKFLPVTCVNNRTTKLLYLLVDTNLFSQPASRSFYIVDPRLTSPPNCPERQVVAQFGKPQQVVYLQGKTILIYNYDLISKMASNSL